MKSWSVPGGPSSGDEVGLELDEIAGHEPRGEAEIAQDLHQQPARIAARARAALERLFRGLHARLHADEIFDLARKAAVEIDDEIDRAFGRSVDPVEKRLEARPDRLGRAVDERSGLRSSPYSNGQVSALSSTKKSNGL